MSFSLNPFNLAAKITGGVSRDRLGDLTMPNHIHEQAILAKADAVHSSQGSLMYADRGAFQGRATTHQSGSLASATIGAFLNRTKEAMTTCHRFLGMFSSYGPNVSPYTAPGKTGGQYFGPAIDPGAVEGE